MRSFTKRVRSFLCFFFDYLVHDKKVFFFRNFLPSANLRFVLLLGYHFVFHKQVFHWCAEDFAEVAERSLIQLVLLLSLADYVVAVPV